MVGLPNAVTRPGFDGSVLPPGARHTRPTHGNGVVRPPGTDGDHRGLAPSELPVTNPGRDAGHRTGCPVTNVKRHSSPSLPCSSPTTSQSRAPGQTGEGEPHSSKQP